MGLKQRIEKLEEQTAHRPEPKDMVDFVLDYHDGQPPRTVKITRETLANIVRIYGPPAGQSA
jgi:hypothetical protein